MPAGGSPFQGIADILQWIVEKVHNQYQREIDADVEIRHYLSYYLSAMENEERILKQVADASTSSRNKEMLRFLTLLGLEEEHRKELEALTGEEDTHTMAVLYFQVAGVYFDKVVTYGREPSGVATTAGRFDAGLNLSLPRSFMSNKDTQGNSAAYKRETSPNSDWHFHQDDILGKASKAFLIARSLFGAVYSFTDQQKTMDIVQENTRTLCANLLVCLMNATAMNYFPSKSMMHSAPEDPKVQMYAALMLVAQNSASRFVRTDVYTIVQSTSTCLKNWLEPCEDYMTLQCLRDSGLNPNESANRFGPKVNEIATEGNICTDNLSRGVSKTLTEDHIAEGSALGVIEKVIEDQINDKLRYKTTHALIEELCDELKSIYMMEKSTERQAEIFKALAMDYHQEAMMEGGSSECYIFASGLLNAALVRTKRDSLQSEISSSIQAIHKDFLCAYCKLKPKEYPWLQWQDDTNRNKLILNTVRSHTHQMCEGLNTMIDNYYLTTNMKELLENEKLFVASTGAVFTSIATTMKMFVRGMIAECETVLGPPPCIYAVMGLGSLAREEATPFSDLEFAILIERDLSSVEKSYFWKLVQYLHLKVIDLGETPLPSLSIPCLNDFYSDDDSRKWFFDAFTPSGFKFDGSMPWACKTPLGRKETVSKPAQDLILTPVQMAALQSKGLALDKNYHLPDVLYCTCLITGHQGLYNQYIQLLHSSDQDDNSLMRLKYWLRGKAMIARDLSYYDYVLTNNTLSISFPFNVKRKFYRMPSVILTDLRIMFASKHNSTWIFLGNLRRCVDQDCFDALHQLAIWTSLVHLFRLLTYDAKGSQHELLSFCPERLPHNRQKIHGNEKLMHIKNRSVRVRVSLLFSFVHGLMMYLHGAKDCNFPWLSASTVWISHNLTLMRPKLKLSESAEDVFLRHHTMAFAEQDPEPNTTDQSLRHFKCFFQRYEEEKRKAEDSFTEFNLADILSIAVSTLKSKEHQTDEYFVQELCRVVKADFCQYAKTHVPNRKSLDVLVKFSEFCLAAEDYSVVIQYWCDLKDRLSFEDEKTTDHKQSSNEESFKGIETQGTYKCCQNALEFTHLLIDVLQYKCLHNTNSEAEKEYLQKFVALFDTSAIGNDSSLGNAPKIVLSGCYTHPDHSLARHVLEILLTLQYIIENPESLLGILHKLMPLKPMSVFHQTQINIRIQVAPLLEQQRWEEAAKVVREKLDELTETIGVNSSNPLCFEVQELEAALSALCCNQNVDQKEVQSEYGISYSREYTTLSEKTYEMLGDELEAKQQHCLALLMYKRSKMGQCSRRKIDIDSVQRIHGKYISQLGQYFHSITRKM